MKASLKPTPGVVKEPPVVTLTTDFGTRDPFVGVMKGVILRICPGAQLVDLTHELPPQDVLAGAIALEDAVGYFPAGTVHLAVVDPGVGTDRPALAVRTDRHWFVAPDNGLLSFLPEGEIREIRRIENPDLWLHPVSATFHGRDVFAPVAAHLAAGIAPERVGPLADGLKRLAFPRPRPTPEGLEGEILGFDRFGNAFTNLRRPGAAGRAVGVAGRELSLLRTYAEAAPGQPLALWGSSDRLEIAVRNGSARRDLGLERGDRVVLRP
ncbi:MAG: hypothetical protein D6708_10915 [Candidatus Dadabacteria bacterium]|nr:MAG: hypothetical protein D6708_10915 [Candidatus Dadabacteria bacterium]